MNLKLLGLAVAGTLLFTGCSSKEVYIAKGKAQKENIRGFSIAPTSTFASSRSINTTNTRYLQITAEETLRSGYRYFEFATPKTIRDLKIGSVESFMEKCTTNSTTGSVLLQAAAGTIFSNDTCGLFKTDKGSSGAIKMYKEKPAESVSVLDANEVLEYLKLKQLLIAAAEEPEYTDIK